MVGGPRHASYYRCILEDESNLPREVGDYRRIMHRIGGMANPHFYIHLSLYECCVKPQCYCEMVDHIRSTANLTGRIEAINAKAK